MTDEQRKEWGWDEAEFTVAKDKYQSLRREETRLELGHESIYKNR